MSDVPRVRMFAGPNGSGKSTFKSLIRPELIGIYVNPDEIEKEMRDCDCLDLKQYQVSTTKQEILDFFLCSSLLKNADLLEDTRYLHYDNEKLSFQGVWALNAYFASVVADFIRHKLMQNRNSFTFETVMSFPDKIDLLQNAQKMGYRTYLYYVATEDPAINVSRVRYRVRMGGHSVPEDKIVSRYKRSLELLPRAISFTNRAYIFDNSNHAHRWIAEITNGQMLELKTEQMPSWFKTAVLDKFTPETK